MSQIVAWQRVALNRVIQMRSGDFIPATEIEPDGEYPVYGGNGLRGYTDRFNTAGPIVLVGRQGAHCGNVHVADGKLWVSEHALRCFPERDTDTRWLAYVIEHLNLNQFSVSAAQPGLTVDNLKPLVLPLPPLNVQRRIAAFLDEKTARIDALIAKKRALLERLAEKRQALITRAVTKGLDAEAPCKPSGIDWLGEIPAHWEVQRLRYLGEVILGLTYSPEDVSQTDEGRIVVRASNVQDGYLVHADDVYVESDVPDKLINRTGDIIICSRNGSRHLIGKCAVVTGEWAGHTFGAFMTTIRSKHHDWLTWVLSSSLFDFQSGLFMSSTINQLTTSMLKNFAVPFPPENEQTAIAERLRRSCDALDMSTGKVRTAIGYLVEYRFALVTAAVTGQIEGLQ